MITLETTPLLLSILGILLSSFSLGLGIGRIIGAREEKTSNDLYNKCKDGITTSQSDSFNKLGKDISKR